MDNDFLPDFTLNAALGLARLLPRRMAELGAQVMTGRLNVLHPCLKERLAEANGKTFVLMLSDMPFHALLAVTHGRLGLTLLAKDSPCRADVTIHGDSDAFLALLEGRVDGDALFFSRDLRVEGDTEALLVLRNALDSERIDLRETFFSLFGPFEHVVSRAAAPVEKLGMRFLRDVRHWRSMVRG